MAERKNMGGYEGEERRRSKRIKKPYIIRFQIKPHAEAKASLTGWDMVAVLDLGSGGTLFYYNKKIAEGSSVDLKINFSKNDEPMICGGEVLRVEPTGCAEIFLIAVRFDDIKEDDKKIINKVAEALHSRASQI